MHNYLIREIQEPEILFLENMLYEAIFIPKGNEKLSRDIIKLPELSRYIKDFGQLNDICLTAEIEGKLIGAIWTRIFSENEKGFGFVNAETPELSMAVYEQNRHQGLGTVLLKAMIQRLKVQNYSQVSLSVDIRNYAYNFYKKYGFKDYKFIEKSVIMIKNLK